MERGGTYLTTSGGRCFWPAGYLSPARFSPARLAGLVLWYDAQNAASVVGDPVSQWNDLGPAARNLTQATAANRPDRIDSAMEFGGRACHDFAEGDGELQGWMLRTAESVTAETSGTLWAVASFDATADRTLLGVSQNASAQRFWHVTALDVGGQLRFGVVCRDGGAANEGGAYADGAEGAIVESQAYLLTVSSDGSQYRIWINGRQFGGGGPGSVAALGLLGNHGGWIGDLATRDRLSLGARISLGQPATVALGRLRLAELAIASPEASSSEIGAMHGYLSARYGIALAP